MSSPSPPAFSRKKTLFTWNKSLGELEAAAEQYVTRANRIFGHFEESDPDATSITHGSSSEEGFTVEEGLIYLDSKLDVLTKLEEKLKAARVGLQELRNRSVTLAPINRLPPEILSLIIILANEEDHKLREERLYKQTEMEMETEDEEEEEEAPIPHFPTLFSHICRQWRQIALSMSSMWTDIDFSEGEPYDRAKEWLQRSRKSELSLTFNFYEHLTSDDQFERAIALVGEGALRTTSLTLKTNNLSEIIHAIKHLTSFDDPPPLKNLTLEADVAHGDPVIPEEFSERPQFFFKLLGGLERLDLERVHLPWSTPAYSGLRSLRLAFLATSETPGWMPTENDIIYVMESCPDLEKLELVDVTLAPSDESESRKTITLNKLTSLTLDTLQCSAANFLISFLALPSLRRLHLRDIEFDDIPDSEDVAVFKRHLPKFLNHIAPDSLNSLRIDGTSVPFYAREIKLMLAAAPNLEELSFGCVEALNDSVLQDLLPPTNACMKLHTLKLQECRNFSGEMLKAIVDKRNPDAVDERNTIKKLVVKYCGLEEALEKVFAAKVPEFIWGIEEESDEEDEDDTDIEVVDNITDDDEDEDGYHTT